MGEEDYDLHRKIKTCAGTMMETGPYTTLQVGPGTPPKAY